MAQNTEKNRKSEAEEIFDEADNTGRFAGNDADAQEAKRQATENIRQDSAARRDEQQSPGAGKGTSPGDQLSGRDQNDQEARRDAAQTHDYKGEAQNVNDDEGRPMTGEDELQHARNKANEGIRQNREDSDSGTNDKLTK
jgi:hypothetical protein